MAHRIGIDARNLDGDSAVGRHDRHIRPLVAALAELDSDNDYFLFVSPGREPELDALPANFRLVQEPSPVFSIREQASLSWQLLRLRLDLYHATHYLLPAFVPCRALVSVYDVLDVFYPRFGANPLAQLYVQRAIRNSLGRADRVIAGSRHTKTDLMDHLGLNGRRIRVVYPGVNPRFAEPLPAAEIEQRLAALGIERPFLLVVQDEHGPDNLDVTISACARAARLQEFSGQIVLSGPRTPRDFRAQALARRAGVEDQLRLLYPLTGDDRTALFQSAEVLLYPTLAERVGPTLVEALAAGVPVLAANSAGQRELGEGHAVLADPLDADAVGGELAALLGDAARRAEWARLAARRGADFAWRRSAEKTLEVYDSTLRQETRKRRRKPA